MSRPILNRPPVVACDDRVTCSGGWTNRFYASDADENPPRLVTQKIRLLDQMRWHEQQVTGKIELSLSALKRMLPMT
jgi:hypothetical protein